VTLILMGCHIRMKVRPRCPKCSYTASSMANLDQHEQRRHGKIKHTVKRAQGIFLNANRFRQSLRTPSRLSALPNNVLSLISRGLTGKRGTMKQQYTNVARNLTQAFNAARGRTRKN